MIRLMMILLGLIAWREDAAGANYYISPTGSDSNACTGITDALACATFPRCAAVMSPGDTCYALDGTYTTPGTASDAVPNQRGWYFNGVGGSSSGWKRFTSLSQNASAVTIQSAASCCANTMTVRSDYMEFSHLTIYGRNIAESITKGPRVHHNIHRCPAAGERSSGTPPDNSSGNNASWYIYGSNPTLITEATVYENQFRLEDGCDEMGAPSPSYRHIEWLGTFYTDGTIVEKNDFIHNSTSGYLYGGFLAKRGDKNMLVRQNYFQTDRNSPNADGTAMWMMDCLGDDAATCLSNAPPAPWCNNKVYQNVFVNSNPQVQTDCSRNQWIYNNTVINPDVRCFGVDVGSAANGNGTEHQMFNNICYCTTAGSCDEIVGLPFYGSNTFGCAPDQDYLDNNLYFNNVKANGYRDCGGFAAGNLVDWKTHLAAVAPTKPNVRETNSKSSDPLFVNVGAENYRLQPTSPARTGGRGVGYPSMLGAYVTAAQTDQIGCSFDPSCYGYTAPTVHLRTKVR